MLLRRGCALVSGFTSSAGPLHTRCLTLPEQLPAFALAQRLGVGPRDTARIRACGVRIRRCTSHPLAAPPLRAMEGGGATADPDAPTTARIVRAADTEPGHPPPSKRQKKKGKGREFDYDRYHERHVAFRVAYIGARYHGFASQGEHCRGSAECQTVT